MAAEEPTQRLSSYFSYRDGLPDDLEQGDILSRTEELQDAIRPIHPYYLKPDYSHFVVLTQSCDLVRRHGKSCRAPYINIAAVRPLYLVIQREIDSYQDDFDRAGMLCSKKHRFELKKFMHRLVNQNEPEYFHLHAEPALGFLEPHCAFLRLAIPIKSEHYERCLRSRILSLKESFQAKLGWLVGNLFSRVGTEEWVPTVEDERALEIRISKILDKECRWVDDKKLSRAKKQEPDPGGHRNSPTCGHPKFPHP